MRPVPRSVTPGRRGESVGWCVKKIQPAALGDGKPASLECLA